MRLAPLKNLGEELFPTEPGGALEYDVIYLLANIEFSAKRIELSHKTLVASKADHTISLRIESTKIRKEMQLLLNCWVFEFMISYACFRTQISTGAVPACKADFPLCGEKDFH